MPMLVPPPEPPRPGWSPPEGDVAMEPLPPLVGIPVFQPGCDETTIALPALPPPSAFGGASTEPMSPGPPRPEPFLPEPETPVPEPSEGGGGTTLPVRSVPLPEPLGFPAPAGEPRPAPGPVIKGGGAMTFDPPRVGL